VVGIETDFNWSDVDDKVTLGGIARIKQETKWEGATRGRIGYAFDHFLIYGAAGVAYAKREFSVSALGTSFSDKKTAVGWTVGGGVEAAVTDNVIVRVDYRYTDYGKDTFVLGGPPGRVDLGSWVASHTSSDASRACG
jgi:outer membrane immunogenic protein